MVTKKSPAILRNRNVTDLAAFDAQSEKAQDRLLSAAVRIWRNLEHREAAVSFDFYCEEVPGLWRFLIAEAVIGLALIPAEDLDY